MEKASKSGRVAVIKLHLFTHLGQETGHLYSDTGNYVELKAAALLVGLREPYFQKAKLPHYDLWGRPLILAKKMYNIVGNREFVADLRRLKGGTHELDNVGGMDS